MKKLELNTCSKGGIIRIPYEYGEFINTSLKVVLIKEDEDNQDNMEKSGDMDNEENITEFQDVQDVSQEGQSEVSDE
jgi:hypothetical protein